MAGSETGWAAGCGKVGIGGGGGWCRRGDSNPEKQEIATLLHSGKRCICLTRSVDVWSQWMWKVLKNNEGETLNLSACFCHLFLFSFAKRQKWGSDVRSPAVAVSHLLKSLEAQKKKTHTTDSTFRFESFRSILLSPKGDICEDLVAKKRKKEKKMFC